jgi:hypothetical protein
MSSCTLQTEQIPFPCSYVEASRLLVSIVPIVAAAVSSDFVKYLEILIGSVAGQLIRLHSKGEIKEKEIERLLKK